MRRLAAKAKTVISAVRGFRVGAFRVGAFRVGPRGRLSAVVLTSAAFVLVAGAILWPEDDAAHEAPLHQATPGGETVMAKFAKAKFAKAEVAKTKTEAGLSFAEPTPVSRLLSMALAPVPIAPTKDAEPNLAGLSEIPRELIWNRPAKKDDDKKRRVFATFSKAAEQLPWDAVEPVPFSPLGPRPDPATTAQTNTAAPATTSASVKLASAEIANWVKSKVTEIKGSERSRPLYHFELWLEPPATVKGRLVGVSYSFNTPAIRPQSQSSSDRTNGFRISAGGLACADEITLTLRFNDGRSETVAVDGCKLLS